VVYARYASLGGYMVVYARYASLGVCITVYMPPCLPGCVYNGVYASTPATPVRVTVYSGTYEWEQELNIRNVRIPEYTAGRTASRINLLPAGNRPVPSKKPATESPSAQGMLKVEELYFSD